MENLLNRIFHKLNFYIVLISFPIHICSNKKVDLYFAIYVEILVKRAVSFTVLWLKMQNTHFLLIFISANELRLQLHSVLSTLT